MGNLLEICFGSDKEDADPEQFFNYQKPNSLFNKVEKNIDD